MSRCLLARCRALATGELISHPLLHRVHFSFLFFEARVVETCLLSSSVRMLGPWASPPSRLSPGLPAPPLPTWGPPLPFCSLHLRAWLDSPEKWDHAVFVSWFTSLSAMPSRPILGAFLILVLLMLLTQSCPTLCDPMGYIAHQAPLSVGFSRQEYWSGCPFPSPGDLPDPGIIPRSPALWRRILYCLSH